MSESKIEESGLNESGQWDGKWDTVEGRKISNKWKNEAQYRLFKNKLLKDIANMIYTALGIIFFICVCLCLIWETTVLGKPDESLLQYLISGIHNILNYSPIHLRIFIAVSVILTIITFVVFIIEPLPLKETD